MQLPGLEALYDDYKEKGIDEVYCLSVNDSFVMNAWAQDQKLENVKVIPCLLYTSPSPRDATLSRMPSSA